MNIKVVLFDLDGTLLPMDQEEFVKARMGRKDGNQMSESYTENEEVFADIVISGRIFDGDGLSAIRGI